MCVTALRGSVAEAEDSGVDRTPHEADTMMSYTFVTSPIYSAGELASAWAVVALFFGLLAFA
jgi:hypothetical protein